MTGSGEDKTKEKLEHCVLYSHHGASLVFSVKWLWQLWGLRSSPSYMAQTVGIRLNMLALYQASSLSKSIKHDFTTATEHMFACLCVCVWERRWGRETDRAERKIPAWKGRTVPEGRRSRLPSVAAHCCGLLKAPFYAVQGAAAPLTARHKHNILHPWERYC